MIYIYRTYIRRYNFNDVINILWRNSGGRILPKYDISSYFINYEFPTNLIVDTFFKYKLP